MPENISQLFCLIVLVILLSLVALLIFGMTAWIVCAVKTLLKMEKERKRGEELDKIIGEIEKLPIGSREREIRMGWARAQVLESFVRVLKIAIEY